MVTKIDVLSVPFAGHLYPTLTLVLPLLEDDKYQVRVFTGMNKVQQIQSLGFKTYGLFPDKPSILEEISDQTKGNALTLPLKQLRRNFALVPQAVAEVEALWAKEGQPDLLIGDFITMPTAILAKKNGIPWITTNSSPVSIEGYKDTPSYLGGLYPRESLLGELRNRVIWKMTKWGKALAFYLNRSALGPYRNFALRHQDGSEGVYSPDSILALGLSEMDFRKDYPDKVKWVGYKCLSFDILPPAYQTYFQGDKPRVLLTSGTHLAWHKERLIAYGQKLAQIYPEFDFYVTLGDRSGLGQPVQQPLPNCLIFPYLPYTEVIKEFSYVLHHGGIGILMAAIDEALPSLIMPLWVDQFDYAARADYYGLGIHCKKDDLDSLVRDFKRLIEQKSWPNLEKMSQLSKETSSTAILYGEIERLLANKKDA